MCGIAGLIGRIAEPNRRALERMTDAIAHRGPDSAGSWQSAPDAAGFGCLLGHRRLSILDLSSAGDQPMTDERESHAQTIVYNGEIYNFKTLREELQRTGERFTSSGDTAVILRLLALRGPEAVARLRGMFALALWDDRRRRLVLARDPLGIKPLYVCRNPDPHGDWSLLFASEVRSILASGLLPRPRLDRRALASVLWNGFVIGPGTIVEGIESLQPGELRVVDGAMSSCRRYWHMPRPPARPVGEDELRDVLLESVKLHLVSDVPLGIFLSGGIDSSAVANLAQRASEAPVHTFTLAFEEVQYDEGRHSRAIAEAIGTVHREIVLTEQQFAAALETAVDTIDQPTFDGLNSYYVSKAVREAGLTVALVGTGGDELFGGYPTFHMLPLMQSWARRTSWIPTGAMLPFVRLASRVLSGQNGGGTPPQTRWAKLPDMVKAGQDLMATYQLAYALFLPDFRRRLLLDPHDADDSRDGLPGEVADRLREEADGRSPVSAVSVLEQRLFLGERLLRDTDAASMAVSLETRLPLVDSVVTDAVTGVDDGRRFAPLGRKQLLRQIGLVGLDPQLFERPKRGFVLPFDTWIRRSLGRRMDETMRDEALARDVGLNGATVSGLWSAYQAGAPGLYWSRVWVLYVLIRWCHRHGVLVR
jgi:asparagine synthase (glutamine-hydrolysing)